MKLYTKSMATAIILDTRAAAPNNANPIIIYLFISICFNLLVKVAQRCNA